MTRLRSIVSFWRYVLFGTGPKADEVARWHARRAHPVNGDHLDEVTG